VRYYIQSQGQVWLLNNNGKLRLPTPEEVPFKVRKVTKMHIDGEDVVWCDTDGHDGPGWFHRDRLLTSTEGVEELAKKAAILSYPRVATHVAILNKGKVLLVRSIYGLSKGLWMMPGGFVEYGEHPASAVRREVLEETGLKARNLQLLSVENQIIKKTGMHFVTVLYTTQAKGKIKLQTEEVAEARWFDISKAQKVCRHPTSATALRLLRRSKHG
jgi:ADP-ribose pyrophosphatase YjhB (NUDIX family)